MSSRRRGASTGARWYRPGRRAGGSLGGGVDASRYGLRRPMGGDRATRPRRGRRARVLALAAGLGAAAGGGALMSVALAADQSSQPRKSSPRLVAASRRTFGQGAWSWFADPRAVYSRGRIVAGWVDRDRYVNIASIKTSSVYRVRIGREAKRDDHGHPALTVRPARRSGASSS